MIRDFCDQFVQHGTMPAMSSSPAIITLLTDFGEDDSYVGAMKGVILTILPTVRLIDLSHRIAPQNIRQAALLLANVYRYYPAHTVHLVVVDPGVGSERHSIAVRTERGTFVAPDNGVLSYVWQREPSASAVLLDNPAYWLPSPSHTFHGRDVFSPVAAHLAGGVRLDRLGPALDSIVMLPTPPLTITPTLIEGTVVYIDHFGNVMTNIAALRWLDDHRLEFQPGTESELPAEVTTFDSRKAIVNCGWHTIHGIRQTYSQSGVGQTLALIGSSSELEIAVNQGHAARDLNIEVGDPVKLYINS